MKEMHVCLTQHAANLQNALINPFDKRAYDKSSQKLKRILTAQKNKETASKSAKCLEQVLDLSKIFIECVEKSHRLWCEFNIALFNVICV